jgi:hypothetical protein
MRRSNKGKINLKRKIERKRDTEKLTRDNSLNENHNLQVYEEEVRTLSGEHVSFVLPADRDDRMVGL